MPPPTKSGRWNSSPSISTRRWSTLSPRRVASGRLIDPAEDGLAQMIVLDRLSDGAGCRDEVRLCEWEQGPSER